MGVDVIAREVAITFVDLLILYVVANNLFDKRRSYSVARFWAAFLLFVLSVFCVLSIGNLLLKITLSAVLITLLLNVLFDEKILNVFFSVIILFALFMMVEYAIFVTLQMDSDIYTIITNKKENLFSLAILSRLIVFLIVVLVIPRKKKKFNLAFHQVLKFSVIFVLTILGILSTVVPEKAGVFSNDLIVVFVLMFNTIFIYYILSDFIKMSDNLRIHSLNKERIEGELILYKELERKTAVQKKILHDYKNTLTCVKGLVYKEEYEELENYVDSLSGDFELAEDYVSTGNTLVDVLINNKYQKAFNENITLVLKLDNLSDLTIKSEDMITILSNLLDNAIEHCMTLKGKEKQIFLKIKQDDVIRIVIKNPVETEIEVNGYLVRTTKIGDNHGIGLKNIKDIVEKYHGNIVIDVDDGYFVYLIEI